MYYIIKSNNRNIGSGAMKLIAHRGASLERIENTIESLVYGAQLGAYAVECDIRLTKDGRYIIFHDPDLRRTAGADAQLHEHTYAEIASLVEKSAGYTPILFEDICERYHEETPILLHINTPTDDRLIGTIKRAPFNYICGINEADAVKRYAEFLPAERILGFIPSPDAAGEFINNGAGNIRLWEQWLDKIKPADIKAAHPETEVWIMANRNGSMNGCPESLDYIQSLGADGVLLNDIVMAVNKYKESPHKQYCHDKKVALQLQHDGDCYEMIKIASESGFRYVSMGFGSSNCFLDDGWREEICRLKAALEENNLKCVMTHSPYYNLLISAEILDEAMETAILRCVQATAMLGADIIAIHPRAYLRDQLEDTEKSYYYNVQNLTPLVREAEKCGCRIGIENLPTYPNWAISFYSNYPNEHKRLVDTFDSQAVCAVWDFGHAFLANDDPADALLTLGSRISGTHVHDNNRVTDDHFIPFGGSIDWESNIEALKQTGFDGYLTSEVVYESLKNKPREEISRFIKDVYEKLIILDSMLGR